MDKIVFQVAGVFLIAEAGISVAWSQDQQPISNVGRLLRVGLGIGLILW